MTDARVTDGSADLAPATRAESATDDLGPNASATTGVIADPEAPPPVPGADPWMPGVPDSREDPVDGLPDGSDHRPPPDPPTPAPPSSWPARLIRGRPQDPAWVRPAFVVLLVGTGFLYIWGLGQSGWANSFYSAAVQAGTKSWKAFFFGSSDAANFITVDKPPASLWVMEISARIFGVNAWSILVPQALEGVATVGVLFVTVRRWFNPGAALLAGSVVALTPVATLMFRYNNPDALLTLVLTLAAYATVRAIEDGRSRWMVLAGALIGFGFITKMLQALILIPVLALVYLLCGPPKLGKRILQLIYTGVALLVAGGWWVAAVQLTPAADRPYVGGSANNSELNLIFGYNGFGRLTGNETGSVGGGLGRTGGKHVGTDRMGPVVPPLDGRTDLVADPRGSDRAPGRAVDDPPGSPNRSGPRCLPPVRWLAALHRCHPQLCPGHYPSLLHDRAGAGRRGTGRDGRLHAVATPPRALPPPGPGGGNPGHGGLGLRHPGLESDLVSVPALGHRGDWRDRRHRDRSRPEGSRRPGRRTGQLRHRLGHRRSGGLLAHHCCHSAQWGYPLGRSRHSGRRRVWRCRGIRNFARNGITLPPGFTLPNGVKLGKGVHIPARIFRPGGPAAGLFGGGGAPGGGFGAGGFGRRGGFAGGRSFGNRGGGAIAGGAAGGLLNAATPGKQLTALLAADASRYTWVAAADGSNTASGYQLATGDPVMAIGGFNGTDPAPTLSEFQKYVSEGRIHYFISGGGFGGGFGGGQGQTGVSDAEQISSWVDSHFTAQTVDGVTLYNLTTPIG